jgi:hypothetical protein
MTLAVEKLAGEPVVIITIAGFINLETLHDLLNRSHGLESAAYSYWYRIFDVTNSSSSFTEVLRMVGQFSQDMKQGQDAHITTVLVGANEMEKLMINMLKQPQHGGVLLPVFRSKDDALHYIRLEIANRQKEMRSLSSERSNPTGLHRSQEECRLGL